MPDTGLPAFKVATYNIHSCLGTDRKFAPERIVEVLQELDADLVALQEVGWHLRGRQGFDQYDFFARHSDYHVCPGVVRNHEKAHFGNALLTRGKVLAVRNIDLSVPYRVTRGAIDIDVEIGGRKVRAINAHFGLDPLERRIQFQRIVACLHDQQQAATVLMGDFNEWRLKFAALAEFNQFFPEYLAPRSFHSRRPLFRFDRIYASRQLRLSQGQAVASSLSKAASDHLPVCGQVHWAGEPEDLAPEG